MTLPNFVIVGASKSGTTSLYHWLRQHPDVFMPAARKDTFFFCYDADNPHHRALAPTQFPVTTLAQYEQLFEAAGTARAVGEATPLYLDDRLAPSQMRAVIPEVRIIASLREPVSRMYSHAQMNVRHGLASDVVQEVRRLSATDEPVYSPKLERWLSLFPRERFFFLRYDDLVRDADAVVADLCRFLGIDHTFRVDTTVVHNPGGVPRSRVVQHVIDLRPLRRLRPVMPIGAFNFLARLRRLNLSAPEPLDPDLRAELVCRFRDDLLRVEALTALDLSDWTSVAESGRSHSSFPRD